MPLYWDLSAVFSRVHASTAPQEAVTAALVNAGYAVSGTHAAPGCVKTDAPPAFIWALVRAWEAAAPVAPRFRDKSTTLAHAILVAGASAGDPAVDFSTATPAYVAWAAQARAAGPRFVSNPQSHWGPGTRASAGKAAAEESKRARKQ